MRKVLLALLIFLLCLCVSGASAAQVPAGSVRLDLGTSLAGFQYGGWNPDGPEDWLYRRFEVGIGNPNVSLGLGATVIDALAIGLRFSIAMDDEEAGYDKEDSKGEPNYNLSKFKTSFIRWGIWPYLEYAFLDKVVRPFLMLMLGFEGHVAEPYQEKATYWDFVFGAGGGVHFFVVPTVSLDLTILAGFSAGGGSIEPTGEDSADQPETNFTRVLFRLSGILSVSGWF